MTGAVQQSNKSGVTARLIELISNISEDQQRTLLRLLEEDWQYREQRNHPRKPCFIGVDYATRDRVFKDFIQNINAGGVFIETRMPFSVGQEITLIFSFPNYQKPVKIAAEITRSGPQGIGVKFKMANQYLKAMIKSL